MRQEVNQWKQVHRISLCSFVFVFENKPGGSLAGFFMSFHPLRKKPEKRRIPGKILKLSLAPIYPDFLFLWIHQSQIYLTSLKWKVKSGELRK